MDVRVLMLISLLVIGSGCMSSPSTEETPIEVPVTPCNTANTGIQIRIKANGLENATSAIIKPELEMAFIDNFKSPAADDMRKSYMLNCYWGTKIGQKRSYYYCDGSYRAPDLDENQIIRRFILKSFTIGFSVEEHNVGSWTDSSGITHNEGSVYYLTTKTVDSRCILTN
ncbi:MAG: hypothetical protein V1875_04175 [Candidatus Altiarchaeota archaeon]